MVLAFRIAAWWNPKARLWIRGRKGWQQEIPAPPKEGITRYWFHVSSLGEFEQARPVIEKLRDAGLPLDIVVSFFSPSGYDVRKNFPGIHVLYLPADLPGMATRWIRHIQPAVAVFVKYDFWAGYLKSAWQQNCPVVVISAHFRPDKKWQSWNTPPARDLLKKSKKIFLQNDRHLAQLHQLGFHQVEVTGDTRIDRVLALPTEAPHKIPEALQRHAPFDIVAGSTWPDDEALLFSLRPDPKLRFLIAPHDVSSANIQRILATCPFPLIPLSKMTASDISGASVLVDSIGLLAYLYAVGKVAYVGGGFGKSIHNILEPAAHGVPIMFGPNHSSFPEAEALLSLGGAREIKTEEDLRRTLSEWTDDAAIKVGKLNAHWLHQNKGAVDRVSAYLLEYLPFRPK